MAPTFPVPGQFFADRYRIESVLAEGGFGRVYRATQVDLERDVAIKILRPNPKDREGQTKTGPALEAVIKRFEREARLVSKLRDTHTVTVHDFGSTDEGLLYMVMEFVDGVTVGELIDDVGKVPPERAVRIVRQALSSLQEAHQLGVLHRDIKPHNIMLFDHLGREDQVKVLDFGLVKSMGGSESGSTSQVDLTSEGSLLGTPRYMSPEQIRGDEMGPPSDIYSLGLVFYEMLSGTKAVDADSTMNIIARHLDPRPFALPRELQLPIRLRQVLARMLEKTPENRYQNVDEVAEDLEDWDSDEGLARGMETLNVTLEPIDEPSIDEPPPASENRRLVVVTAGVIGLFAVAATVVAIVLLASPPQPASTAPPPDERSEETARPVAQVEPTTGGDEERMLFGAEHSADAGSSDAGTTVAAGPSEGKSGTPMKAEPEEPEDPASADENAEDSDSNEEGAGDQPEEPDETTESDERTAEEDTKTDEPVNRPRKPRFQILE